MCWLGRCQQNVGAHQFKRMKLKSGFLIPPLSHLTAFLISFLLLFRPKTAECPLMTPLPLTYPVWSLRKTWWLYLYNISRPGFLLTISSLSPLWPALPWSLIWIIEVVSYWPSASTFNTLPPLHSIVYTATGVGLLKGPGGCHSLAQNPVMAPTCQGYLL